MYEQIISYGLDSIYVCKDNGIPIPIKGAIDISINISNDITYGYIKGNKKIAMGVEREATGRMTILGLSFDNLSLLLGYKRDNRGGIKIDDGLNAPRLHLLFSKNLGDGTKQYYHIYNCRFNIPETSTSTMIEGQLDNNNLELEFSIEYSDKYESYYYMVNSNDCNNFFTELIYPN